MAVPEEDGHQVPAGLVAGEADGLQEEGFLEAEDFPVVAEALAEAGAAAVGRIEFVTARVAASVLELIFGLL